MRLQKCMRSASEGPSCRCGGALYEREKCSPLLSAGQVFWSCCEGRFTGAILGRTSALPFRPCRPGSRGSLAGLISERRPSFLKRSNRKPPACAGTSAATVRDKLYPECAFSAVIPGAAGAAQRIHAGLCRTRSCAGVSQSYRPPPSRSLVAESLDRQHSERAQRRDIARQQPNRSESNRSQGERERIVCAHAPQE